MGRLSDLLNKNGITSEVVEVVEDGPIALPTVDQFAEKHEQRHAEAVLEAASQVSHTVEQDSSSEPKLVDVSLNSHAVLSYLHIRFWRASKQDKDAAADYAHGVNANPKKMRLTKHLLDSNEHLIKIKEIAQKSREIHERLSKEWMGRGARIMPATVIFEAQAEFPRLQAEFYEARDKFFSGYETAVDEAELEAMHSNDGLGTVFNRNDYPTLQKLHSKFEYTWQPIPLSDGCPNDWRLAVADEAKEYMSEQYKSFYEERIARLMSNVYTDAFEKLTEISSKLDYRQGDKATGFHKTLVDRALELVHMLKHFNLVHSADIESARVGLENALRGVTIEALRDSERLRNEVISAMKRVMQALPMNALAKQ